jgi:hypothetical protein
VADTKISGLPLGTATTGDLIPIARGSINYAVTVQGVAALAYPVAIANLGITGSPGATNFARGDGTWSSTATTWTMTTAIADSYQMPSGGIITDSNTSRTLSGADNGKIIWFTNAAAITVTTASGLGAGFACTMIQGGTGQITVAQGSSTTRVGYSNQYKSSGQYGVIAVLCPVADTFVVAGNVTA